MELNAEKIIGKNRRGDNNAKSLRKVKKNN